MTMQVGLAAHLFSGSTLYNFVGPKSSPVGDVGFNGPGRCGVHSPRWVKSPRRFGRGGFRNQVMTL